jgi:conjugal transfer pilus assembly protein TraU
MMIKKIFDSCSTFWSFWSKNFVFLWLLMSTPLQANCVGRFVNPMTDICWGCLFPVTIGGLRVSPQGEDTSNPRSIVCTCKGTPPRVGIPISFWEPVRLVDVTRTPYCMVNMGGIKLMDKGVKGRGGVDNAHQGRMRNSFYQVHWYIYPVIYWLELLVDFVCLEKSAFDIGYITELDPFWNDDETAFIINPEAVLFGNPMAQAACAADCLAASGGFAQDALFWCGGCQGSLYPFTGTITAHVGGVQGSLLAVQRMIAKLHREGFLWGTMGQEAWCDKYPMPILKKTQYKTQMTYPIASTQRGCHPLGRSEVLWSSSKEFPHQGEDFGYLIWRKRSCCLL